MTRRANKGLIPPQSALDNPEYLNRWTSMLVKAVGKREARTIRDDYLALSESTDVPEYDRGLAAQRAKSLTKYM